MLKKLLDKDVSAKFCNYGEVIEILCCQRIFTDRNVVFDF